MFSIGDKVVYPSHGAGTIIDIESKEILGKKREYFVLSLPIGEMKVMLPIDNIDNLGLREISSSDIIPKVYDILAAKKSDMSNNWNRRYRNNQEKIKTGDIYEVAKVVKDLMIMENEKGLSTGEKKMLLNTKQILVSEIALINDKEWSEVEEEIDKIVVSS